MIMSEIDQLVSRMNSHSKYARLDPPALDRAYETIRDVVSVFQRSTSQERARISAALSDSSKFIMAEYTSDMAVEGRRMRSRDTLLNGLIAVVVAGAGNDSAIGAYLMTLVLRSAEASGIDSRSLFEEAGSLITDQVAASQVRVFPSLGPTKSLMKRYGVYEKHTNSGVVYGNVLSRVTWWQRLRGRKQVSHEETLRVMRAIEENQSRQG